MDKDNKYTCIFGGGAIRGLAYIGAMQALQELGINCDKFVGSSVGAIFASLYALGYSVEEVKAIMLDFNVFMFKDLNFNISADFAFSKGDVFEDWIREKLEKIFYGDKYKKDENPPITFKDIEKNLYICSTDLTSNSQFIFSKTKTPNYEIAKAVRISACFPGLMKPIEYDNKILVDGDLAKCLPLWMCDEELISSDNRILEFRLEGCRNCLNLKSVLDYFNAVYSTMSNFSTENIINMHKDKDKIDYILIDTKDVLLLDFQMPTEMREKISQNGYETTIKYFTETLVEKKQKLVPLYEKTLTMLNELKVCIKKNSINKIKTVFADYIFENNEDLNNMDYLFLKELKNFKTVLTEDIKALGLLPLQKIMHKTEHIKVLQGLIEQCEQKTEELKNEISTYSKFKTKTST